LSICYQAQSAIILVLEIRKRDAEVALCVVLRIRRMPEFHPPSPSSARMRERLLERRELKVCFALLCDLRNVLYFKFLC
jgi:hypothetical protein